MRRIPVASLALTILSGLILFGCGSTPTPQAPAASAAVAKKEPMLFTGKNCLSQTAGAATRWQPDALPVHMESEVNAESTGQDGKSTVWRAMYVSPGRGTWRSFACSGSRLNDEPGAGVTSSPESPISPEMSQAIFQSLLLMVDSDKAFEIAQKNGGEKLLQKNPQQPVMYLLDWDHKSKQLVWAVLYGTSQNDSKGIGIIDATSGKFLRAR
ncbi:MAG: hypothetical protein ACLQLC_14790 [Candidatus Sulfotelmatobacter sp.]